MKATINGFTLADSADTVECHGYQYFPRDAVRMACLQQAPKTESDHACPHGVRFYDVVIGGTRYARTAWSYEAPRPAMIAVDHRLGFWNEVTVG